MYLKSLKIWGGFFLSLLLLFFVFPSGLGAQAPIRILSLDSSAYPHISLRISARKPHLDFVREKPKIDFTISEIYENLEKKVEGLDVHLLKKKAEHLNLVWILDASLSLNSQNFQKANAFSQKFIQSFQNGERMAIYSAKAKPELLLDFSNEKEKLSKTLKYIKHDGKVTRLYDAIYAGLYTAQSARESNGKRKDNSRTVAILLTDGKEESSYFNDNDCYELSSIGKRLNIPIYVILWNGEGAKKNKNETEHLRLLKRLSLKTNGKLFSNPRAKDAPLLLQKLYQLRRPVYRIHYLSQKERHGFPGTKVIVRVALTEGGYGAVTSFRVPWFSGLGSFGTKIPILWLAAILALLLGLLLIFLFVLPYRRRKAEGREALQKAHREDYTLFEKQLEKERAEREARGKSLSKESLKENDPSKEQGEIESVVDEDDPLPPLEGMENSNNVLIENERSLYLREHSYRLLQLALRDALPYRRAALRTVLPSEPPQKRVYDLFLDSTLLGSGRWAHIPVRDPLASPVHARIKKIDKRFVIYDMLSGSGLYVNRRKLLRPKGLRHGDEIRIGRMVYTFLGK